MYSENKITEGIKSAIISGKVEVVEKLLNRGKCFSYFQIGDFDINYFGWFSVDKWKARCQLDGCDCSNVTHILNEVCPDGETLLGLATKVRRILFSVIVSSRCS